MNQFHFPKSRRLLRKAEFDRVFQQRRSHSDATLIVYAWRNELSYARLGMAVSRKAGNAVVRVRWKRCIREAFRLVQRELPSGFDLVVLPRPGAAPTTAAVQSSLQSLAERLAKRLS